MPSPNGGPCRKSHRKSRKGCKTCKRRHIRCDETFPQCSNCTKHQVLCDYREGSEKDSFSSSFEQPSHVIPANAQIDKAVDSWRFKNRWPFAPSLKLVVQPLIQVGKLSQNEVRLLYHVHALVDKLIHSNTKTLDIWSDVMPKFLSLAAENSLVLQAILSFSAAILAWETDNEDIRSLSAQYSGSARINPALNDPGSDLDALLAALTLLSWVETDWLRWSQMNLSIATIMANIQTYHSDSILSEFIAHQTIGLDPNMNKHISRHFPSASSSPSSPLPPPQAFSEIQRAMTKLSQYLPTRPDIQWMHHLSDYLSQIMTAKRARQPQDQFNYLYHLRKLLLWSPTALLAQRSGDMDSLLILSYFYGAALKLVPVFPDIGEAYLGNYVLAPLQQILAVLRLCERNCEFKAVAEMATVLIDFPQSAVTEYLARQLPAPASAALPLTLVLDPPFFSTSSSTSTTTSALFYPTSTSSPSIISSPYIHNPSMSPAALFDSSVSSSTDPRSPFLRVPSNMANSNNSQLLEYSHISSMTPSPSPSLGFGDDGDLDYTTITSYDDGASSIIHSFIGDDDDNDDEDQNNNQVIPMEEGYWDHHYSATTNTTAGCVLNAAVWT